MRKTSKTIEEQTYEKELILELAKSKLPITPDNTSFDIHKTPVKGSFVVEVEIDGVSHRAEGMTITNCVEQLEAMFIN